MSVTISGSGQIIKQVIQVVKTDTTAMSGAAWNSISGLSASITPTNASNKIMVMFSVYLGGDSGSNYDPALALYRNGSIVSGAIGDTAGSRLRATTAGINRNQYEMQCNQATYMDSPATTSATTYAVYGWVNGGTVYVNREVTDTDNTGSARVISTLTLMEVAYA